MIDDSPTAVLPPQSAMAEEEILRLYLRLKPLTSARQVLGVDATATPQVIWRAYDALLLQLDPVRVPDGPRAPLLRSYMNELRRKADDSLNALLNPNQRR